MSRQRLNSQAPVHELIAARWSPRAFAERPVELQKLASCLEAARWAPSCYNDQPWRFLVADRYRDEEAWQLLLECLVPVNRRWANRAPVLVLTCAAIRFRHNGQPNRWSGYDAGQAVMALVLQAADLGLAAHQMAGFDAVRVRAEFKIPEQFEPMTVTALGYPGEPTVLDEDLRERELAPRQRCSLEEIAFTGCWGLSWNLWKKKEET